MEQISKTILLIEDDAGFTSEEFTGIWNAHSVKNGESVATVHARPITYDAGILEIIGRAADFIAIAGFVGLPTIWALINSIRGDKKSPPLIIDETVIEIEGEQVKKIVIRRSSGSKIASDTE